MQKYRRWTDEATGINPFINAKVTPIKISTILQSSIITVIKLHGVLLLLIPIIFSLFFQKINLKIPLIKDIYKLPIKILCMLLGLWDVDDANLKKWGNINKGKGRIILSNSVTIIDAFYYMSILQSVKFIIISAQQQRFQCVGGLSAVLGMLTKRQPFFTISPSAKSISFKNLLQKQLKGGHNCIIFYEGIRTNGLGTIKISTKLSKQLYNLQKDYCIVHLKYTDAPQNLFSTASTPFYLFLVALGCCTISLKVRSSPMGNQFIYKAINSCHSSSDIQKDVDTFLLANAAKLLDTNPASYFDFIDYYYKIQTGNYYAVAEEETNKNQ